MRLELGQIRSNKNRTPKSEMNMGSMATEEENQE
jgi:hypothetical protein